MICTLQERVKGRIAICQCQRRAGEVNITAKSFQERLTAKLKAVLSREVSADIERRVSHAVES